MDDRTALVSMLKACGTRWLSVAPRAALAGDDDDDGLDRHDGIRQLANFVDDGSIGADLVIAVASMALPSPPASFPSWQEFEADMVGAMAHGKVERTALNPLQLWAKYCGSVPLSGQ